MQLPPLLHGGVAMGQPEVPSSHRLRLKEGGGTAWVLWCVGVLWGGPGDMEAPGAAGTVPDAEAECRGSEGGPSGGTVNQGE